MTVPPYNVTISPRAKHARLKMSAKGGLVVVVPNGFDQSRIPGILHKKRDWVRRIQERFEEQQKFLVPEPSGRAPERITLRVIGQDWAIDYRRTDAETVAAVERADNRLLVFGDVDDLQACKAALRRWLARKTYEHVVPWLTRLSKERSIPFEKTVVKFQRTRWASCSAKKTITLNLRLMCLPEHLVRYVLLHELAHCLYMNHSRRFWVEVAALDPDYEKHDKELRNAWRLIPAWLGSAKSPLTNI